MSLLILFIIVSVVFERIIAQSSLSRLFFDRRDYRDNLGIGEVFCKKPPAADCETRGKNLYI